METVASVRVWPDQLCSQPLLPRVLHPPCLRWRACQLKTLLSSGLVEVDRENERTRRERERE